ncbi:MAG: phenylacetate--CoA ligase family protein [Chloroflexota bacterium]|nr:phenylacetate--CoA ligase family protein [Chloroflexota bacterium]
MTGRFWNEAIETLSPGAVRRLENERLAEQIAYDYATSPFYRARLDMAGVKPDQIRHVADLPRIPFMEKAEIADSQADGTLLGANQCAPLDRIVRIQATGGTTGQPMRIGLTRRDIADYCETGARALWAMGCRPGDIVFECMNYNLYAGGLSDHLTFETVGAATIPFGVGHSERLLTMMAGLVDPIGIWATPSYAVRLAEVAGQLGIEPRSVGLRRGYFSGEAGLQVPGYRERIQDTWGMVARDQYGTGELGLHSGECEQQNGVHFGGTGIAIAELVDPDSGEVLPFTDGQQGEVVYTSIHREACPLLRMRSHDLMQVFTDPCACGRTSFRFRILGRSDDMFIVKGVNVFPLSIQAVLMSLAPRVTGEFRVVIDRPPPIDYPVPLTVEVAPELPAAQHEALAREVATRLRAELNFTAAVSLVRPGGIATEKKTRRVIRSYRVEVE